MSAVTQAANEGSPNKDFQRAATSSTTSSKIHTLELHAARSLAHLIQSSRNLPKDGLHGFSAEQILVLGAFADTFVHALDEQQTARFIQNVTKNVTGPSATASDLHALATFSPVNLEFVESMILFLKRVAHADQLQSIQTALQVLATRPGALVLTNSFKPFYAQSLQEREKIVSNLFHSRLAAIRILIKSIGGLTILHAYGRAILDQENIKHHPAWRAIGYPGHPEIERPLPKPDDIWRPTFLNIDDFSSSPRGDVLTLACDVVVVGSGAGGGVVAAELAKAGHNVVVLEKAFYTHPTDLPFEEMASFNLLYERGGSLASEDGSMQILAGSAWGGGTFVNWSASLRLPAKIREEWATKYGLPYFLSRDYNNALDAVCDRAGVGSSAISHNKCNQLFMEGSRRLGMPHGVIPQNTAGKPHRCGFCVFGCPYAEKQGTHVTFLRDAAESGNARFVHGCTVDKVLRARGKAIGVKGTITDKDTGRSYPFVVNARKVVVSCGSLQTPTLLLRSGLRNPNIGRHLRLHPCTHVFGVFRDTEEAVKPWSGSIMTAVGTCSENVHGDGYGAKLECCAMHLSMYGTCIPWRSAEDHKTLLAQFDRIVPIVVIARDSDATDGQVKIDKTGAPRIHYAVAPKDQLSITAGVETGLKTLIAAGATEVFTNQLDVPPFVVNKENSANVLTSKEFGSYLDRVRRWGYRPTVSPLFTAHQMGSCRMAGDPSKGACNPEGQTWEVQGLYVADASLFPTASGVNPMVTVMSLAYTVAQQVKKDLVEEVKAKAKM